MLLDQRWIGWALREREIKTSIGQVSERPTFRYQAIADALRARIASGEFAAGALLPSESDLSGTYDASRVTVRKAFTALREEGLVDSRQGFGWFVAASPLRQTLGRLGTLEDQLAASGVTTERRVLEFGFVTAPKRALHVLGVTSVLQVRRLNLADGTPFARVTVWVPEKFGAEISRAAIERATFYEMLPFPVGGATQTIGAAAASESDAALLAIPTGSPVLRCERITNDADGNAVLLSEFVFPGHLTEFVVDLPRAEGSIAPTGLRLVD